MSAAMTSHFEAEEGPDAILGGTEGSMSLSTRRGKRMPRDPSSGLRVCHDYVHTVCGRGTECRFAHVQPEEATKDQCLPSDEASETPLSWDERESRGTPSPACEEELLQAPADKAVSGQCWQYQRSTRCATKDACRLRPTKLSPSSGFPAPPAALHEHDGDEGEEYERDGPAAENVSSNAPPMNGRKASLRKANMPVDAESGRRVCYFHNAREDGCRAGDACAFVHVQAKMEVLSIEEEEEDAQGDNKQHEQGDMWGAHDGQPIGNRASNKAASGDNASASTSSQAAAKDDGDYNAQAGPGCEGVPGPKDEGSEVDGEVPRYSPTSSSDGNRDRAALSPSNGSLRAPHLQPRVPGRPRGYVRMPKDPQTGRLTCYYFNFGGCTNHDACDFLHVRVDPRALEVRYSDRGRRRRGHVSGSGHDDRSMASGAPPPPQYGPGPAGAGKITSMSMIPPGPMPGPMMPPGPPPEHMMMAGYPHGPPHPHAHPHHMAPHHYPAGPMMYYPAINMHYQHQQQRWVYGYPPPMAMAPHPMARPTHG